MTELQKETLVIKRDVNSCLQKANQMVEQFEHDKHYQWGNNEEVNGKLKRLVTKIKTKLTAFDNQYLITEWKEMMKIYGTGILLEHLEMFKDHTQDLRKFKKKLASLSKMHLESEKRKLVKDAVGESDDSQNS